MLTCASINVHGLRDLRKRNNILSWLNLQNFDVIFLQETHFTKPDDVAFLNQEWSGSSFHSFGSIHSCGVSILFKNKTDEYSVSRDLSGRFISVRSSFGQSEIEFCNIYAPNIVSDRADFFNSLISSIKGGYPTVLGGDFNCIEDIFLDKFGGDNDLGSSDLDALGNLLLSFDVIDVFRHLHPSTRRFTWHNPNHSISCRLDRIYVSREVPVRSSNIIPFSFSDHDCPVVS